MRMKFTNISLITHQINFLNKAGFKNITVVVSEGLKPYIEDRNVRIVLQKGVGMGAAVLSAAEYIQNHPVLVVIADDIVELSLFQKLNQVCDSSGHIMVGYKTSHYFPGGYLVLDGQRIAKIHEKPGKGNEPSNYVYMSSNFFTDASLLLTYLEKFKDENPNNSYELALSNMMSQGERFNMMEYSGIWLTLKYPWQTLRVMDYYLGKIKRKKISASAQVHKTATIIGNVVLEKGVRVMENAKLVGPLYIDENTIIGNHVLVRESMIGRNCVVGYNCDVTRSYISNNCWFHSNYVGDSVIADNVAMGAGAVLANLRLDEGEILSSVNDEKIHTRLKKLGAMIGDCARIGIGAQLMPGIKVGVHSVIGPGVILAEDVGDEQTCFIEQKLTLVKNKYTTSSDRESFRQKLKSA